MTIAEQNQKLLELIGDRQMTAQELEAAGGCLIINGLAPNLRAVWISWWPTGSCAR